MCLFFCNSLSGSGTLTFFWNLFDADKRNGKIKKEENTNENCNM